MTLGERIASLRTGAGLSQQALAERLEVSRQAVSKWETDASVPELNKLMQLADLFAVSLDQLLRDEEAPRQETPAAPEPSRQTVSRTQQVLGFILLAVGLLALVLGLGTVIGLLGGALALSGAVCLLVKRHAGLVIGWLLLVPPALFFNFPLYFALPIAVLLSWTVRILAILVVLATVRLLRPKA